MAKRCPVLLAQKIFPTYLSEEQVRCPQTRSFKPPTLEAKVAKTIGEDGLDILFREARGHYGWSDQPLPEAVPLLYIIPSGNAESPSTG